MDNFITVLTSYYHALGRVPLVMGNKILVSTRSSAALQPVYSPGVMGNISSNGLSKPAPSVNLILA